MKATVLTLALLCAGTAFAQTSPSANATSHTSREARHMEDLATLLDLTEAQQAQVQSILEAEHAKMKAAFEQAKASGTRPDWQQTKALHSQIQQETLQAVAGSLGCAAEEVPDSQPADAPALWSRPAAERGAAERGRQRRALFAATELNAPAALAPAGARRSCRPRSQLTNAAAIAARTARPRSSGNFPAHTRPRARCARRTHRLPRERARRDGAYGHGSCAAYALREMPPLPPPHSHP